MASLTAQLNPGWLAGLQHAFSAHRHAQAADPPPSFFLLSPPFLRAATRRGKPGYLLAFLAGAARTYCTGKGFASAGSTRNLQVPALFASQAGQWKTVDAPPGAMCTGQHCPAYSIIECYIGGPKQRQLWTAAHARGRGLRRAGGGPNRLQLQCGGPTGLVFHGRLAGRGQPPHELQCCQQL